MIEGADRFHFQGACLRDYTLVLVFDEGLLTADLSTPGWGVMPPAQLLQCVPGAERRTRLDDSDASDAREGGSSSTASFEDSDDSDDDPDNLTASTASPSLSRSGSPSPRHGPSPLSSTDHTPGPSPRPLSPDDSGSDDTADDEEALHPPPHLLGWRPRDLDLGWTTGFFEAMQGGHRSPVHGLSLHFYSDFRNTREKVSSFDARGWHDVVREGLRTENVITGLRSEKFVMTIPVYAPEFAAVLGMVAGPNATGWFGRKNWVITGLLFHHASSATPFSLPEPGSRKP